MRGEYPRIKGFRFFKDRHGRWRCYHRRTGDAVDLIKYPLWSAELYAECARINALAAAVPAPKPGTLGMLIETYRGHASFAELAPRTRVDYQRVFDYLKPIADTPLYRFDRPLVVKIRDKAVADRGRRQGNYVKTLLSIVFAWGSERGYIETNPASGIKQIRRKRGLPDANRPWSDRERHAVLERVPAHMRLAIGLMMFTGLGPADALKLRRDCFRDGKIATRRSKTGEPVFWPCPTPLAEIIEASPKHDALTLCATSQGKPWTVSGFNSSWRPIKRQLEEGGLIGPSLTLYGLRHTVAILMKQLGFDDRTIADALGQETLEMAHHYSKRADIEPKMGKVVRVLDKHWHKQKTKTVKPGE